MASVLSMMSNVSMGTYSRNRCQTWALIYCTVCWVVAASVVLLILVIFYRFSAVDDARERYVAASADRVGFEAVIVLSAAMAVRDAIDYAIQRKQYFEPLDYSAVRMALEAVLVAAPAIRAVDLAFIGRNESIKVQRLGASPTQGQGSPLLVQSDAVDCYDRLGALGCLSPVRTQEQPWYRFGQGLSAQGSGSFQWMDAPGFVPQRPESAGAGAAAAADDERTVVAWAPAYSLVFRSDFPGTGGGLSLVGRATLDISNLRAGDRLGDATQLGAGGAVYVCDRRGTLVAAVERGQQVVAQSPGGRARFRHIWELDLAWAQQLQAEDFATGGQALKEAAGFQIIIAPLRGRGMEHFAAIVAADRQPFLDELFDARCNLAQAILGLPYPVGLLIFLALREYNRWKMRRHIRRVHAVASLVEGPASADLGALRSRLPSAVRMPTPPTDKKRGFGTTIELRAAGVVS